MRRLRSKVQAAKPLERAHYPFAYHSQAIRVQTVQPGLQNAKDVTTSRAGTCGQAFRLRLVPEEVQRGCQFATAYRQPPEKIDENENQARKDG